MTFSPRCLADTSRAVPRRSGRMLRQSAAAVAVAALTFSACSSGDDAVSSDDVVEQADDAQDAPVEVADAYGGGDVADTAALQQNGPVDVEGAILDPYESTLDDLSVGMKAPVVRGESFDGSEIVIGAPTENPTMVVFLAHWCPHCNAEIPVLLDLEANDRLPENLDVVGVSTAVADDRDNFPPSQWIVDKGWSWPTMADDEALDAFGAYGGMGFPFTVVLDTDGTVLARRSGEATGDDTVAFLDAALADATA